MFVLVSAISSENLFVIYEQLKHKSDCAAYPCHLSLCRSVSHTSIVINLCETKAELYVEKQMSRIVRKQAFCICENKDADQLRGNREADQRLCFRYMDSTIPLLSKSEISRL